MADRTILHSGGERPAGKKGKSIFTRILKKWAPLAFFVFLAMIMAVGCSSAAKPEKVFRFSGIPDQNASLWAQRYATVSQYLTQKLGVKVEAVPSADYAAVVTAFEQGDIQMGWFGGLTGVQARLAVPGSQAIAMRPVDEQFHSVFIVQSKLAVENLTDLKGLTFTFGSESSTSGHLMPRYYLMQAGINPDKDFNGLPGYSGSHDKTWQLVQSGAYQAGVLSQTVWDRAVKDKQVDTSKVRAFYTTPAYFDYNWTIRGDVDKTFGPGFTDKVKAALLAIGPANQDILDLFQTDKFIPTQNSNYDAIETVAKQIGIIQ